MSQRYRREHGRDLVELADAPLARGGEGEIFVVRGLPNLLAKIYHKPTADGATKLRAMIAAPPESVDASGQPTVAWPIDRLWRADRPERCVGFLMPRIDGMRKLTRLLTPRLRHESFPRFTYSHLLQTARNLAAVMATIHARGYVIGDVNDANVLVSDTALVRLIDTDSFQVRERGQVYRCCVGTPEFTPPELQGARFSDVDRQVVHDAFGLAVLVFQLLMEGHHPFTARFLGQGEPLPREERLKRQMPWPYALDGEGGYQPPLSAPPLRLLAPEILELFRLCFERGQRVPDERPNAVAWVAALDRAGQELAECRKQQRHLYRISLPTCPWCQRSGELGFDAFLLKPGKTVVSVRRSLSPLSRPILHPAPYPGPQPPVPPLPTPPGVRRTRWLVGTALVLAVLVFLGWYNSLVPGPPPRPQYFVPPQNFPPLSGNVLLTLRGHVGTVLSVCYSPDGKQIASSSEDRTVKVWDAGTGTETLTLKGHAGAVNSVRFSPDGQQLASGSDDGTVKVWDARTGKEVHTLKGHSSCVNSISFSPDGTRLASGSTDHTVRVWDVQTGKEAFCFKGHSGVVYSVCFSPDGKTIASGGDGDGNAIKWWDAGTGNEVFSFEGHTGYIASVAWSPDGMRLAGGSWDRTLRVWDSREMERWPRPGELFPHRTLEGHSGVVCCVAFSPDSHYLASCSSDRTVMLWDARTRQGSKVAQDADWVKSVAFSPDGNRLVSGGKDQAVKVWGIPGAELEKPR